MRHLLAGYPILVSCISAAAGTQNLPSLSSIKGKALSFQDSDKVHAQAPIMNPSVVLPSSDGPSPESAMPGETTISDVLGIDKAISIFSSFTRDVPSVFDRLGNASHNTTVFAPLNAELAKLPRKPWEDPEDYSAFGENAYDGAEGGTRAQKNLRRFVESHIVTQSPWQDGVKAGAMGGNTVWYEIKEGKKMIQPGNIEVVSVADRVSNGEVWILKGVLNYA